MVFSVPFWRFARHVVGHFRPGQKSKTILLILWPAIILMMMIAYSFHQRASCYDSFPYQQWIFHHHKKSDKRINREEEISINVGKICHFHFYLPTLFLSLSLWKSFYALLNHVEFSCEFKWIGEGGMIAQSNHFIALCFVMKTLLFIGFGDGERKFYCFIIWLELINL